MANHIHTFSVAGGDDGQLGVFGHFCTGVDQLAVDSTGEGRLGQPGTDVLGNFHNRNGVGKFALAAIGQGNNRH